MNDAAFVGATFVEVLCLSLSSNVLCNIFLLILLYVGVFFMLGYFCGVWGRY